MKKLRNNVRSARFNLNNNRIRQKQQYDKKVKLSRINVNDTVMMSYNYNKRGVSKCFIPKWNGPWLVLRFTGPSNCVIVNSKGEHKNVNIDQLKKVETRDTDSFPKRLGENSKQTDVFDNDISDCEGDECVHEGVVQEPPQGSWCEIDSDNIIPFRTRSGRGEV